MGYLLASPIRRLFEKPEAILEPFTEAGMTAVDIGCAMGFFSLPLARLVGPEGRVVCVDVQQRMLKTLVKRARRQGLDHVIETRLADQQSLGLEDLEDRADLALAFHVVHETDFPERFLQQCRAVLRPGGLLLIAEPRGHVKPEEIEATLRLTLDLGFDVLDAPELRCSYTLLLKKAETV
jgi:ubiquinone/menaquinone biosynthesis C-methylase UbiE